MKLISVGGQIASGKDTFSDYLVDALNKREEERRIRRPNHAQEEYWLDILGPLPKDPHKPWKKVAFADGLKKVMMDAFGENIKWVEHWKRNEDVPPEYLMTVRQALQFIGDGFRKIKASVWIDLALREEYPSVNKVISDVRYLNEAETIKKRGGISILLWRPGFENTIDHPSEAQIRPHVQWCVEQWTKTGRDGAIADWGIEGETPKLFDYFFANVGSVLDLYAKVDHCILPYLETRNV